MENDPSGLRCHRAGAIRCAVLRLLCCPPLSAGPGMQLMAGCGRVWQVCDEDGTWVAGPGWRWLPLPSSCAAAAPAVFVCRRVAGCPRPDAPRARWLWSPPSLVS
jgi:hypothetical protein